jgi:hypothetical protein
MTDLVARLRKSVTRGHEPTDADAIEAADEIDRLRIAVNIAKSARQTFKIELDEARAEIERLYALCDNLSRIAISKEAALTDAEWVGYYFGLQRALNMKRLPAEFVSFLDHEMHEVESKLPPGTIENWPKTKETE